MKDTREPFGARATAIQRALRESLGAALATASLDGEGPTAVARALGIDLKLAWKVDRLLAARTPADALRFVPGRRAQGLLRDAYRDAGAPPASIAAVEQAFERFEQLVRDEAGSRKDFEALLASMRSDWSGTEAVKVRRSLFEGQSSLLGIQADLIFGTVVFSASQESGALDVASVRGFAGLRALRPGVIWRVGQSFYQKAPTREVERGRHAPLEEPDPRSGAPVLRKWCTDPLPELIPVDRKEGIREYRLRSEDAGASTAVELTLGDRHFAAYRADPEKPDAIRTIQQIRTPSRRLVNDTFVERGLFDAPRPTAEVFSTIFTGVYADFTEADLLPMVPDVIEGDPGGKDRRLADMQRELFQRLGRDPGEFDRVRVELAYPPVPASLRLAWTATPR